MSHIPEDLEAKFLQFQKEYDSYDKKTELPLVIQSYIYSLQNQVLLLNRQNTLLRTMFEESLDIAKSSMSEKTGLINNHQVTQNKLVDLESVVRTQVLPEIDRMKEGRKKGGCKRGKYEQHEKTIVSVLNDYLSLPETDRPTKEILRLDMIQAMYGKDTKQIPPDPKTIREWIKLYGKNDCQYLWSKPLD